jgi:hypothetical protein
MTEQRLFRGFFSYAHHDAETDPQLVSAFTEKLEKRVNSKLTNAYFTIWRDKGGLRIGDRWNERIEAELRGSDVLIVLLTPRWIGSAFCRKEYAVFEEVEDGRGVGTYIAPILIRTLEKQQKYFSAEQHDVYQRIKGRQHHEVLAIDFLKSSAPNRTALIDKIADDIEGMIERRRLLPSSVPETYSIAFNRKPPLFKAAPQNYERVDFVTDAEIEIDGGRPDGRRDVLAQIVFVERLFVEGKVGRIEFGVSRAFLEISHNIAGKIEKANDLKSPDSRQNAYYVTLHETPESVCVCMDPESGRSSLAELALPPAVGGNYWAKVATADADVLPEEVTADLVVSLSTEGLYLVDDRIPVEKQTKIKAIMDAVATKIAAGRGNWKLRDGHLRRTLFLREKS